MAEQHTENYTKRHFTPQEDSYNSIIFRLDPTRTLQDIKQYLLKETEYDNETESYYRVEGCKPMFDEAGVNDLMTELKVRMSVDKVLSNLSENDIKHIVKESGDSVLEFIFFNSDKYGIEEADITRIFNMIIHNIEIFLKRAKKGVENELLNKSFSHKEVVTSSGEVKVGEQPSKPFMGFGGRR